MDFYKDAKEVFEKNKYVFDATELAKHDAKIRADAIEEYCKEMHDIIEGNEEFIDWQKYEIFQCNELVAEELKEKKDE